MKKITLFLLLIVFLASIASAKVAKSKPDSFDGSYAWYDDYFINKLFDPVAVDTTFNVCFPSKSKNLIIQAFNEDIYYIDPYIEIKIDDKIYGLETLTKNIHFYGDGHYVMAIFAFQSEDIYNAFMTTEQDIAIRFTYRTVGGHYRKDYKLPIKFIKEVQQMYNEHEDE